MNSMPFLFYLLNTYWNSHKNESEILYSGWGNRQMKVEITFIVLYPVLLVTMLCVIHQDANGPPRNGMSFVSEFRKLINNSWNARS